MSDWLMHSERLGSIVDKQQQQLDILSCQMELMHAHVENLIKRVYELEGDNDE